MTPQRAFYSSFEKKQNRASNPDSAPLFTGQTQVNARAERKFVSSQLISFDNNTGEDEIEETIITAGARSVSTKLAKQTVEIGNDEFTEPNQDGPKADTPKRQNGFHLAEELPSWFPKHIKDIYVVDRHGGALSFKELNDITRYRALLEIVRRRKWKQYLKAGEMRWRLQKVIRALKARPLTKAFCEYRKNQYNLWKEKALRTWMKLEKLQQGTLILDETINVNFRQERMIYAKKLRGSQ